MTSDRYSEALDALYGSNVLHFDDPYNLQKLSESVPPQRLASIRRVHVEVLAFHNGQGLSQVLANWKRACIVLVRMTGLRTLHVALGADNRETDTPSPRVGPFLEILRKVKAPEFLVEIPSNATLDGMTVEDGFPFVLVRREWSHGEWAQGGQLDDPRVRQTTGSWILPPRA